MERTGHPLKVHVVETVAADGKLRSQLTVICPVRHTTVSIDECIMCARGRGMRIDDDAPGMGMEFWCADGVQANRTAALQVGDVMTREVVCVLPALQIRQLATVLLKHRVSGVPVVDELGHVLGSVSRLDLLRRWNEGERAADVMEHNPVVLPEDAPLSAAIDRMRCDSVPRIVVTDDEQHVLGILTVSDVVRRWAAGGE